MNLLLVSQYFWPESFMINDLVLKLQALGHTVSVYTGKPNYPDGLVYPGYQRSGVQEENYQGIPVYRVPLRPRKNGGALNLMLNYASFVVSGLVHAVKFSKNKRFDLILVYAPSPITSAIPAIFLKWLMGARLAVWVQDAWPESVRATGFIQNRVVLKCIEWMVRCIYYCSDLLLVQSEAFILPVSHLSKPNKTVIYYPNSAIDMLISKPSDKDLPPALIRLLEDNCCIVFAGNIGKAQSVETIIDAAETLKHLLPLKLVLVGSGSMSVWVEQQIVARGLTNVILPGRFPSTAMPSLFSRATGLLVTLKRDAIFTYIVPCKIQSYLSAGKPIIAAMDGEGARVVKEAGAGFTVAAEDARALAECIEQLYHMPHSKRDELGQSGRAYFLEHFEMTRQSQRLVTILEAEIGVGSVCQ